MRKKRKVKTIRFFIFILFIGVFSICASKVMLSFLRYDKILQTDSERYVIAKEGIPSELVNIIEKNPELRKFVSEYPEKKDKRIKVDISNDIEKGNVPLFMQWDEQWGYFMYGDNMMGLTGCGPTALSMVLVYLQGEDHWNPYEVAQYAQANGYYEEGVGTRWALMSEGASALGVKVEELTLNEDYIRQVLRAGNPIICSMGPGDFTETGHFIVLTGIDKNNKIVVHDPNRMSNTNKVWDYDKLKPQIVALWAYYM